MLEHLLAKQLADSSLGVYDTGDFEGAVQTFLHGLAGPEMPRQFHRFLLSVFWMVSSSLNTDAICSKKP